RPGPSRRDSHLQTRGAESGQARGDDHEPRVSRERRTTRASRFARDVVADLSRFARSPFILTSRHSVRLRSHAQRDVINQPLRVALRNCDLQRRGLPGIIKRGRENAVGMEESVIETHVVIDLDWRRGNTELRKTLDHVVALRWRHFRFGLRVEVLIKQRAVVFNDEPVDDLMTISDALFFGRGPGGIQVPPNAENDDAEDEDDYQAFT